jgi:hypothetical protein
MSKGFRVAPQGSKKDQLSELKTELANMQMAGRISQMMTQQLMQSVKSMGDDLGVALNQVYDLQYKNNALIKLLAVDPKALGDLANQQRLVDFNEASAKQDTKDNLVSADVVGADSTVVITSTATAANGDDAGIFRSRLKLSEAGVPELIKNLDGKKVGDKVEATLNGQLHTVEVLAIRNPSLVAAAVEATH